MIGFSSCLKDQCETTYTYTAYNPVYMTPESMRESIRLEDERALKNPGKIYFYKQMVFINELGKGVHVFDNSDYSNPTNLGFINIPGNYDVAIKEDVMYVDNSYDLISLDISSISSPRIIDIDEGVFLENLAFNDKVFLYYEITDETVEVDCDNVYYGQAYYLEDDILFAQENLNPSSALDQNTSFIGGDSNAGKGGSFARFTISQGHLYTIDLLSLNVFDLSDCKNPDFIEKQELEWGIETIFPLDDKLFIGSNSGLFIFDNSTPQSPSLESKFEHARACDPVFVEGNTAYVTLRNGNACEGFENQMDIIDISDISNPELIASHDMINPHGLSVQNDQVFLCEGSEGLKIIDASDPLSIQEINHIEDFHAYDVISLSAEVLMIIGNDGFYQYQIGEKDKLELLSHIPVKN